APLKPIVPAESQATASPSVSVMVTMVLFCVALMWAMPRTTFLRTFFAFFAIDLFLGSSDPLGVVPGGLGGCCVPCAACLVVPGVPGVASSAAGQHAAPGTQHNALLTSP